MASTTAAQASSVGGQPAMSGSVCGSSLTLVARESPSLLGANADMGVVERTIDAYSLEREEKDAAVPARSVAPVRSEPA